MSKLKNNIKNISFILLLAFFSLQITGCTNDNRTITEAEEDVHQLLDATQPHPYLSSDFKELVDSALKKSTEINYAKGKAYSLNHLGRHYYQKENYEKAVDNYLKAADILSKENSDPKLGLIFNRMGNTYEKMSSYDSSFQFFHKSVSYLEEINDSTYLDNSYNDLGLFHWRRSRFDSAVIYFEKALGIREKKGNKKLYAATLNNLGTVYYQWSVYDRALEYYMESFKIRKEVGALRRASYVATNIGLVYVDLGLYDKAEKYFKEGVKLSKQVDEPYGTAYAYNSMGAMFEKEEQLDTAEYYYKKGLQSAEYDERTIGIIMFLKDLGNIQYKRGKYDAAKKNYLEALEQAKNKQINMRIAEVYYHLAELNNTLGNNGRALRQLEKSISISKSMDKKDFLRDSYKILEKIYLDKGDYEKAYAYLGEYEKYKSAIINENLTKKITDLEKKFELESYKRELQARQFENEQQELIIGFTVGGIVILLGISVLLVISNRKRRLANNLLEEKNRQIEENKDELEKANNMKDKIFSIIGHDLKNPFTALHGYTDILKDEYEQLGDEEKKEYIAEVSKSSHKIYDLLDNMLNWAAAQTGKLKYELKEVKLKKTVDSVLELSESQAKNKDIQFDTDSIDNIKVKADKYMLEVVLRNLVNNAIKFSHQGGTIELASRQNNGQVIVSVKDNGVGMSEEMKQKIFENGSKKSQIGTKGEKGTGLGITLCHDFIKRNHGELWVESAPQKGTTFKFTLEKA